MSAFIFGCGVVVGVCSILLYANPSSPWIIPIAVSIIGVAIAEWNTR